MKKYDVAVIGAGHAGIEAALASAKLGVKTIIFTINLDSVGNCPCNPSIGGTAKGNLVKELDALGGTMGRVADECCLQSRMLNVGKGAAVQSLRMQIDRNKYKIKMKHLLEQEKNVELKQAEIVDLMPNNSKDFKTEGYRWMLKNRLGSTFFAKSVIIAAGTYLKSKIFVGKSNYDCGPDGLFSANFLSNSLKKLEVDLLRFKTGTPARVKKASINFSALKEQKGDDEPYKFSTYSNNRVEITNKMSCFITWTNEKTKEIILKNIEKSPVYSGDIIGRGPRYCPSIEDKIVRFKDKERHQLFIEPCGEDTEEMYLQGMSSGLPEDVQEKFCRTIKGLEGVEIMRPAYAIEYDCINPIQLDETLEFKKIPYLFGAGQFNGSSGYEEAAVQGFVAGVNAALKVLGKRKFVLHRFDSYIGTLIDDLVTKGAQEPYRMMTARSEYRLFLRQDNVYERLSKKAHDLGLIGNNIYKEILNDIEEKEKTINNLKRTTIFPSKNTNDFLVSRETSEIKAAISCYELLKRPCIKYVDLKLLTRSLPEVKKNIIDSVESEIKYSGYIKRQTLEINQKRRIEEKSLSPNINYLEIDGLRLEAREKLQKYKPSNIGMASRLEGVNPVDITALLIWLEKNRKEINRNVQK